MDIGVRISVLLGASLLVRIGAQISRPGLAFSAMSTLSPKADISQFTRLLLR